MATYDITAPDGSIYEVNAPDGASEEEILAYAQSQFAKPSGQTAQSSPTRDSNQPQDDYMNRENLMTGNPIEDAAIGLGRFATEVGQGVKQLGLMAGEGLGMVDKGRADEYTQQINEDTRRYEQGTQGAGMEDIGYYGGMLAPSLMLPAGGGILGTAAIGAGEAAILPTTEAGWDEKFKQAAIGAGFAGGLRSLPEGNRIFQQWRKNRQRGKVDEDIVALAEQFGVKVPRSVNRPSSFGKLAEEGANLPVIGRAGSAGMRQDSERVLEDVINRNSGGGTSQEAFMAGKQGMEDANSKLWQDTHKLIGDAPVDREHLNNGMKEIVSSLQDTTVGKQMADDIAGIWKPVNTPPPFRGKTMEEYTKYKQMVDDMNNVRGFGGDTLQDLHKFRAQFSAQNRAAWKEKGWDKSVQKRIYSLLTDELENAAHRSYGQKGLDLFNTAVDGTKGMIRTMKNTKVLDKAQKDLIDSETSFVKAATGSDPDRMKAMSTILGKSGAESIRREIANNILQKFKSEGTQAGAQRIRKMDSVIEEFFGADEAAAMRGLGKFMDNIPKEGNSWMRNWLGGASVIAAGATHPIKTAATGAFIYNWTKRQDVTAMLQKLETVASDSPLYKALTSELMRSINVAAGTEASKPVPQIEIKNGRSQ